VGLHWYLGKSHRVDDLRAGLEAKHWVDFSRKNRAVTKIVLTLLITFFRGM